MGPAQAFRMPDVHHNLSAQGFAMAPVNQQMTNPGLYVALRQPRPIADTDFLEGGFHNIPITVIRGDFSTKSDDTSPPQYPHL